MATRKKYYVVWVGRMSGVFEDWETCKRQVENFQGAKYKSFESKLEAEKAFKDGYENYLHYKKGESSSMSFTTKSFLSTQDKQPEWNSISVDAAWNTVTKVMEYQGVETATKKVLFRKGPFNGATNNIGEFLALVHGLSYLKLKRSSIPIYTDSITAIAWVRTKKHKSIVLPTQANEVIFDLLIRAEKWLQNNTFANPIIKWNTKVWGEIPADFGRK